MDSLRGVIERITFHNEENGYTVAKLVPEAGPNFRFGAPNEVAIIGNMAGVNVGEFVELKGQWTVHAEYGKQFTVKEMRTVLPATVAGIQKYLGSGLIKGVGPVTAKRIVKQFGAETLEVIDHSPERLQTVPGIGRKRTQMIIRAWAEQRAVKEIMLFLQSHGVSTSLATKIYKQYHDDAIAVVQGNPYQLAQDIFGVGFLTADKIARSLGIPPDSAQRVAAGAAHALNQASEEGHVYLPTQVLFEQAAKLLDVAPHQVATGLVHLWDSDQIKITTEPGGEEMAPLLPHPHDTIPQLVAEQGQLYATPTIERMESLMAQEHAVYLTPLYYSEKGVAGGLERMVRAGAGRLPHFSQVTIDWESLFADVEEVAGVHLARQQQEAVRAALTHRLVVLTGGPGTGKTTTLRTILLLCRQVGYRVLLAAPTGRAAKRLAETTGQEAKTLHRLLEFKPTEGMAFKRNEESPLEGDLLIVDEASMLDLALSNHLLKAIPPGMHLLLVGDVDQLPSVGAGNVLNDIIQAIETPPAPPSTSVVRLQTIFRQSANSYIVANAHRINQGLMPEIANEAASDFFLFKTDEPERTAQLCVELVQTRIPRRFAIVPQDIQVLSPMHRGVAGVAALNQTLQASVNPPTPGKPQLQMGSRVYRLGDRVMQIRNNYDKDVYNGDMGTISALDLEMQNLTVIIDDRAVNYDFLELDELVHAFAISVHKSQGSEFPAVVIPILTSHFMMLQRNLLYTAVSRARRLVVLVGQPKAIAIAVRNNKVTERYTGLCERLTQNPV